MASTIIAREPDFSDLDLDFIAHPTTGDIVRKKGAEAVKRSVRNLILTNFYDRPFRPGIGSNAQKLLFENPTPIIENFLIDAIKEVIRRFEPRIELVGVGVEANFDYDNNGYTVKIIYSLVNRPEPLVTTIFLERIR